MRQFLVSILLAIVSVGINAQNPIYSKIEYLDKFDDVIKTEQRKAIITISNHDITIEEKGKQPVVYEIIDVLNDGSKEKPINLVDDIYGYEHNYAIVRRDLAAKYRESKDISTYCIFAVHRTITTQFSGSYITEVFWIRDYYENKQLGANVCRIVYYKQ